MRGLGTIINALAIVIGGVLNNLSLVGNILIFCVGINLVWPRTIKVANLLPSLLVAGSFACENHGIQRATTRNLTKECDCMKKKLSVIAVIILVLAICVSAWFYGYYNHKSNDNLPTLAAIAEMSEADVNNLLPGYHIDQLREV